MPVHKFRARAITMFVLCEFCRVDHRKDYNVGQTKNELSIVGAFVAEMRADQICRYN